MKQRTFDFQRERSGEPFGTGRFAMEIDSTMPASARAPGLRQSPSPLAETNIALGGLVSSVAVAFPLFIGLLILGVGAGPSLLMASGVQIVIFCSVLAMGLMSDSPEVEYSQPVSATDDREPEAGDIWWMYPSRRDTGQQLRAAMAAPDSLHSRRLAADTAALGYEVHHCGNPEAVIASMRARPCKWDLLVFDLACAADVESAVDHLVELRTLCPGTRVVLISGSAGQDEFNGERRAICDVTLAKPVRQGRLLDAVAFCTTAA
ncbi:response regulator [Citreimonas salinaria]|uniref:Response regulator receiver domain-containing protein n=1 Tax=Citreimonas salinaria TaxID=321339 RepID=A0A1H3LKM9_9RHOB|nr:response regulator [Citreimonas salinaria]SDY64896.1 hypothetical protein SAMN05444340_11366 [Citreimonas salinaria]